MVLTQNKQKRKSICSSNSTLFIHVSKDNCVNLVWNANRYLGVFAGKIINKTQKYQQNYYTTLYLVVKSGNALVKRGRVHTKFER